MSVNFGEICFAVIVCTIITVIWYIASWFNYEENEKKPVKQANTSNIQGFENDQPMTPSQSNEIINNDLDIPITTDELPTSGETINSDLDRPITTDEHQTSGETINNDLDIPTTTDELPTSGEIINYGLDIPTTTDEHQTSGEIVKEQSDLCRLQDEDFRARIAESDSSDDHLSEGYEKIDTPSALSEYEAAVHPDNKTARLHLSIRYDDERSQLIVQILAAQGMIRHEQFYAPEMLLTVTLMGPDGEVGSEKHTRVFVDNAAVAWREPMTFCVTHENARKNNLYFIVSNKSDPTAPRDRELSIRLDDLGQQNEEINQWFDLQLIQSSN